MFSFFFACLTCVWWSKDQQSCGGSKLFSETRRTGNKTTGDKDHVYMRVGSTGESNQEWSWQSQRRENHSKEVRMCSTSVLEDHLTVHDWNVRTCSTTYSIPAGCSHGQHRAASVTVVICGGRDPVRQHWRAPLALCRLWSVWHWKPALNMNLYESVLTPQSAAKTNCINCPDQMSWACHWMTACSYWA